MPEKKSGYAEIILTHRKNKKTGLKEKRFRIRYNAGNNENLSPSQLLKSKQACHKNIMAHINLAHGAVMKVCDKTGRGNKYYRLYHDGGVSEGWSPVQG